METRINPQKATHIEITPASPSGYIWKDEIVEERVFFGLLLKTRGQKEGYYDNWGFRFETGDFKSIDIVGNEVWFDPFLSVYCGSKRIYGRHYATMEEIRELCSREFPNISVILS